MLVTQTAPAKVNLTLEVLGNRPDGYHEIRSIMQSVNLCDRLTFEPTPSLEFTCNLPGWQAGRSLVSRAAKLLIAKCDFGGASISIDKRIPLSSGLGGDSSDGVATLLGLTRLLQLNLNPEQLLELALSLGSDAPFFLKGGTALAGGRGENISALPPAGGLFLVIMLPGLNVPESKTAALYSRLRPQDYTDGGRTEALVARLKAHDPIGAEHLFNVFEGVVYNLLPGLYLYRRAFLSAGAKRVHLAGAGPALFSLHHSREEACAICRKLAGWPVSIAEFLAQGEGSG